MGEAGLPTCRLGCKVEGTPSEVAEEKGGVTVGGREQVRVTG